MATLDTIARIEQLFIDFGEQPYEGARAESVTALAHALQCAQLAEWAHAEPALVAAAFLHDVGHFLAAEAVARNDHLDDEHEALALPLLARSFGPAVTEPIRLHVQAKRYLVSMDADYFLGLSPASVHSLALQGGTLSREECAAFDLVCDPGDDPVSPGRCAADLCKSNSRKCPAPLVCSPLSGCCVDDPCRLLNCPAGTTCEDGYCMVDGAPPDMSVVRIVDASAMHTDSARDGGALPPVPAESGCACALGGHSAPSDVFLHLSGMVSALLPLLLLLRRRRRDHGRRGQLP